MTSIDFFIQLSEIVEKYKIRKISKSLATTLLMSLNTDAKESKLDLEVEYEILDASLDIVNDEEYFDDSVEDEDIFEDEYYEEDDY